MQGVKRGLQLQDGALISSTVQDCTPIAEYCRGRQNAGMTGSNDMRLAASIPLVIVEKYLNDNGIEMREFAINPEHKRRLLNDPALAHFRIWPGRI